MAVFPPDLNRQLRMAVFPAGPQRQLALHASVPRRTAEFPAGP